MPDAHRPHLTTAALASTVLLWALTAAGCGSGSSADQPATAPRNADGVVAAGGTPAKAGGELKVGVVGETDSWDPAKGTWSSIAGLGVAAAVYDTLTVVGKDGRPHPWLAQSVTPDAKLLHYTITLRPGVRFHDGSPLNAAGVVTALRRVAAPDSAVASSLALVKSIKATGPMTVLVTMKQPWAGFPYVIADQAGSIPSPKALANPKRLATHPVGTGPFRFVRWDRDNQLVVRRNPDYWYKGARPYLDGIVFKVIPDPQTRLAAVRSRQLDYAIAEGPELLKQAAADRALTVDEVTGNGTSAVAMNTAKPPFNDLRARKAVALATDPSAVIKVYDQGIGQAADQPFGPKSPYRSAVDYPRFDLAAAKAQVKAYEQATGKKLAFELRCISGEATSKLIQVEQAMYEAAGMKVKLRQQEFASFIDAVYGGDYQAACWQTNNFTDPDQELTANFAPGSLNVTRFSDGEVTAALKAARSTADEAVRKQAYGKVSQIVARQLPFAWISYGAFGSVRAPGTRFVRPNAAPDGAQAADRGQSATPGGFNWQGIAVR